ncbi:uncharacterized protein si:dkeyp-38g8.5 [Platichthys flesus]|uniref:uncharacterized protein si:dkeyp-38g8.5 n=1 Tax=Platichthys flesus TaxID=8260 RepID=UPI001A7F8D70|nr:uncharacterized protein si:dkeyp-38g8.5 [Platichthys flesus]
MDSIIEERLVEEVRKYEHLYNPTASTYKDANITANSWREISAAVGLDVPECIKTWRRIRDKFVRVKKTTRGRSGDAGGQKVPDFFIFMSWLMPHIKHRQTKSKRDRKPTEPSSTSAPEASPKSSTSAPEGSPKSSTSAPEASPRSSTSASEASPELSPREVEEFVKLRVTNNSLFSGKRDSNTLAWKAILKHMGLQHKMNFSQASQIWENMKEKYTALKNPSDGMNAAPETWAHFHLMDEAAEGRLEGSAPVLKVFPGDKENCDFLPQKRRRVSMGTLPPVASVADRPEIEVSLNGDEEEGGLDLNLMMQEVDDERKGMEAERQVMDKEKRMMERERLVLQRERALLDREAATLERDRATLDREMAMMERERVLLEREKAMVEKDKDTMCREKLALEREKARLESLFTPGEATEENSENHSELKDSHAVNMDRKERFLHLFEKLIESF